MSSYPQVENELARFYLDQAERSGDLNGYIASYNSFVTKIADSLTNGSPLLRDLQTHFANERIKSPILMRLSQKDEAFSKIADRYHDMNEAIASIPEASDLDIKDDLKKLTSCSGDIHLISSVCDSNGIIQERISSEIETLSRAIGTSKGRVAGLDKSLRAVRKLRELLEKSPPNETITERAVYDSIENVAFAESNNAITDILRKFITNENAALSPINIDPFFGYSRSIRPGGDLVYLNFEVVSDKAKNLLSKGEIKKPKENSLWSNSPQVSGEAFDPYEGLRIIVKYNTRTGEISHLDDDDYYTIRNGENLDRLSPIDLRSASVESFYQIDFSDLRFSNMTNRSSVPFVNKNLLTPNEKQFRSECKDSFKQAMNEVSFEVKVAYG